MNFLKTPFSYGSLQLANNIFYSPLAGCSNLPFRQISALYGGPGLHYCEMVKMQPLWRLERSTLQMLDATAAMAPLAAQLVGSDPKLAGPCAALIEEMGFCAIDFNCGCPVDKLTKDGSGSAMLQTPHLIAQILHEMVSRVKIPVSVKIRAGWDERSINAPLVTQLAQAAGATAITVHARTRQQAYRGPADWSYIKACKQVASSILVIGNGDLFSPQDVLAMFEQTGCDGVMISRGCMGRPWIAKQTVQFLQQGSYTPKSFKERLQALKEHYELARGYLPERQAIIEMRKVSGWYLEGLSQAKAIKSQLAAAQNAQQLHEQLHALEAVALSATTAS